MRVGSIRCLSGFVLSWFFGLGLDLGLGRSEAVRLVVLFLVDIFYSFADYFSEYPGHLPCVLLHPKVALPQKCFLCRKFFQNCLTVFPASADTGEVYRRSLTGNVCPCLNQQQAGSSCPDFGSLFLQHKALGSFIPPIPES